MVVNLLASHGLDSRVDGEYLSGGMGELPPVDSVRVVVDDADAPRALATIEDWREEHPVELAVGGNPVRHDYAALFLVFVLGVVTGVAVMIFAH